MALGVANFGLSTVKATAAAGGNAPPGPGGAH
jgi:hypothetical protein